MDAAGIAEEKGAGESDSKGHKNQPKYNGNNLGAFGWSGHSRIIDLP